MSTVYAIIEERLISHQREDEDYGHWRSTYNSKFLGIEINQSEIHNKSIKINFTPYKGQTVYVALVEYSDGDSFGRSEGKLDVAGVFETHAEAEECRQKNSKKPNEEDIDYGNFREWFDYFARIDYTEVQETKIK